MRIIIHHHGALIPFFAGRVDIGIRFFEANAGWKYNTPICAPYADHFKKFYVDTATQYYNPGVLQLALDFFGPEHMLFGSDAPMDINGGLDMGSNADKSVAALQVNEAQRNRIYFRNAEGMLNLV